MRTSDQPLRVFANYPRENTVCLPPGAVARFERGGISDVMELDPNKPQQMEIHAPTSEMESVLMRLAVKNI